MGLGEGEWRVGEGREEKDEGRRGGERRWG